MRVVLVGADFEENLGIGMIAAAAEGDGHAVVVVPFDLPEDLERVAEAILAAKPDIVGLGIQFQHRASEFLTLSRRIRALGFSGHLTCGGQYPTLAWREVLERGYGVDSVVLHEGERSFPALTGALARGIALGEVPGLAVLTADGVAMRTRAAPLLAALDELPFPVRYRGHAKHCGIPFVPLMGSRGCWGSCTYCSITSFYRDARAYGGGKTLRERSPSNVAAEMAVLSENVGGPCIFCFHDDNFLRPRPADSLARVSAIRAELDGFGVGNVAFIGKCRPDSVTPELMLELRKLGVIRLYVGVENASQHGSNHLNRRTQTLRVRDALRACREAGIFVCYNLLLFEPDATIDDVRENVAFMREHAVHPVNFCRAEPYYGTPLHRALVERDNLGGSYLGFNYRIADDRTELLFRVCATAFRQRNFDPAGVANRNMGIGYSIKVLEQFYEDRDGRRAILADRAAHLTRSISIESADFLEQAIDLVERVGTKDVDRISRETALLGLRIAGADREKHLLLDEIYADMEAFGANAWRPPVVEAASRKTWQLMQSVALSASLAVWGTACDSGSSGGQVVDPVPSDKARGLPLPMDPPPVDQAVVPDPPPPDRPMVVDVVPPPTEYVRDRTLPGNVLEPSDHEKTRLREKARRRYTDSVPRPHYPPPPDPAPPPNHPVYPPPPDPVPPPHHPVLQPVDPPPPPPPPVSDPLPRPRSYLPPSEDAPAVAQQMRRSLELIDKWRDTTARHASRSTELALHDPLFVALRARREGDVVRVVLVGGSTPITFRWETAGLIEGEGREVIWRPASAADQLSVAVRSEGGIAVTSLRAREV